MECGWEGNLESLFLKFRFEIFTNINFLEQKLVKKEFLTYPQKKKSIVGLSKAIHSCISQLEDGMLQMVKDCGKSKSTVTKGTQVSRKESTDNSHVGLRSDITAISTKVDKSMDSILKAVGANQKLVKQLTDTQKKLEEAKEQIHLLQLQNCHLLHNLEDTLKILNNKDDNSSNNTSMSEYLENLDELRSLTMLEHDPEEFCRDLEELYLICNPNSDLKKASFYFAYRLYCEIEDWPEKYPFCEKSTALSSVDLYDDIKRWAVANNPIRFFGEILDNLIADALTVPKESKDHIICFICQQKGHYKSDCPQRKKNRPRNC